MKLAAFRTVSLVAFAVAASGCGREEVVEVYAPGDVEFRWNTAFNESDDGLTAVIPLDVLVFDEVTGAPLADVAVIWSSDGAAFADADGLRAADDRCDACVWDAWRDTFVEVLPGALALPFAARTDADGLSRVHIVVDRVEPFPGGGFLPIRVDITAAGRVRSLDLFPR